MDETEAFWQFAGIHRRLFIEAAGVTDRGLKYPENQDSFAVRPDLGVFVIADGFGGALGGALASSLAVEAVERQFERHAPGARASITAAFGARRPRCKRCCWRASAG